MQVTKGIDQIKLHISKSRNKTFGRWIPETLGNRSQESLERWFQIIWSLTLVVCRDNHVVFPI